MAKFDELKDQLGFIDGVTPVLAISLNQKLIDSANSELKDVKKKRELAKLEKIFNSKLAKDILKKGYEIIEDYKILDEEEDDRILQRSFHVVVARNSFTYLTNFKPNEQSFFTAGVRLLDDSGNIASLPDIVDFQEVEVETTIETAIEQYDTVINVLRHIEENGLPDDLIIEEEIDNEYIEENNNSQEEINEMQEIEELSEEIKEMPEVIEEKIYHVTEEVVNQEKDVNVVNHTSQEKVNIEKRNVTIGTNLFEDLKQKIENRFDIIKLNSIELPTEAVKDIKNVRELEPVFDIANVSMNNRINTANQKISLIVDKTVEELNEIGSKLLEDELYAIKSQTSLDNENSPFLQMIKEVQLEHESKSKQIDIVVNEQAQILKKVYNDKKNTFVEDAKKKAELEFDEKNMAELRQKEKQYRDAIIADLDNQLEKGIESLRNQAVFEKEKAEKEVVGKIFELISSDIDNKAKEINLRTENIVEETLEKNELEAREVREKALSIVIKANNNKEEIDEKVRKRTEKTEELIETLEDMHIKLAESEKYREAYLQRMKELEESRDLVENQLINSNDHLNKLMEVKASNEVAYQKRRDKINEKEDVSVFSTKKMATILGSVALICCSLITFALVNANSEIKDANTQSVATTEKRTNDNVTENSDSSEEKVFKANATTKIRVGDTIKIDPENNGSSKEAIVKSIDNNVARVETAENNQYFVSLDQ